MLRLPGFHQRIGGEEALAHSVIRLLPAHREASDMMRNGRVASG
jgi:hypothetical protein